MSFPKAKLTRFNDINDSTPSPADYNPVDVKSRTPGGIIQSKERFSDEKANDIPSQSGDSACFRTPTPIKKRSKPCVSRPPKTDDTEALKEKTVECANKDAYIKELIEQIEDLKDQVGNLKSHREILEKDRDEFQEELNTIEERHSSTIKVLLLCYDGDKKKVGEEIAHLNSELIYLQEENASLRKWHQHELSLMTMSMDGIDEKFANATSAYINTLFQKETEVIEKERELQTAQVKLTALEYTHNASLENIHSMCRKDMETLQKKMRRKILNVQRDYFVEENSEHNENANLEDGENNIEEINLKDEFAENGVPNNKEELNENIENSKSFNTLSNIESLDTSLKLNLIFPDASPKANLESNDVSPKSNLKNDNQKTKNKEMSVSKHKSLIKHSKPKKPYLNMYTESYESTDTVGLQETERGDGTYSITTSFKQEHTLDPNLKVKFYPIKNIEDIDTDADINFYESLESDNLQGGETDNRHLKNNEVDTADSEISLVFKENKAGLKKLEHEYKIFCHKREDDLEKGKDEKIHSLKSSHEKQIGVIKEENNSHLQQVKENNNESLDLAKIQAEEKCKDIELTHKAKLESQKAEAEAVFTECKAIGEYTIRESEIEREILETEIKNVNEALEKVKWDENRCKYRELMKEYEQTVDQFKTLEDKILHDIISLDDEKKQYTNDNFTYDVTIHRMHETVEALTKRLFESDNDVEQLKTELKGCDKSNWQLEEKKKKLTEEIDNLTKLGEDLEIQQDSSVKMFETEIKLLEDNILQNVENYKDSISKIIHDFKTKLETTEYDLQEVAKYLYEQEILNSEAYNLIHLANIEIQDLEKNTKHLEDRICSLKIELAQAKAEMNDLMAQKTEIEQKLKYEQLQNAQLQEDLEGAKMKREETEILTKQINQLQEKNESYYHYCEYYRNRANEYEKQVDEMNCIHKSYIDQSKEYEDVLQKCEEMENRNNELQKLVTENEVLIGPFRQQLEEYEYERQVLLTQKYDAENDARAMGLRYAKMLGHQNEKQKIKHIVDLKEKNFNLLKTNQMMDMKIHVQSKTIEKLKADLAIQSKTPKKAAHAANKENTPHENYASPLRDRNQF